MFGFRGSLELGLVIERECEALLNRIIPLELSLMYKVHLCCDPRYHNRGSRVLQLEQSNYNNKETM